MMEEEVLKMIDELDLPPLETLIAKTIALLGGNPTQFLIWAKAHYDTLRAESENPKPETPDGYDETEKIIAEMLWENTGVHPLDSGGFYGRAWQRNRQIKDWKKTPEVLITTFDDGDFFVSANVFHVLTRHLTRDEVSRRLEKEFYDFAEKPENEDLTWFQLMLEFAKILKESGFEIISIDNTYNYENVLSQDLQYVIFGNDDDAWIILQIHNGADIRGGYTKPRFFKVYDLDYFFTAMTEIWAYCDCGGVTIGGGDVIDPEDVAKNWIAKDDKVICKKCGKEVKFFLPEF